MLTRFITTVQRPTISISLRLLNTSTLRLRDGDHTHSKAFDKAVADIKAGSEKRWLDTVATNSEAIVKGEMQHDRKLGDLETDITKLQLDTIEAIRDKATRGHLHQYDVGRRDTREERIHIDINVHDIHKEKRDVDVGQVDKHKEKVDIDITVKTQTKEKY